MTAGPTREAIDPVRYITNRSSGKMGFASRRPRATRARTSCSSAARSRCRRRAGVRRIDVETRGADVRPVHAAIARHGHLHRLRGRLRLPATKPRAQKIKRSSAELDLKLVRSPDTLASVAALADPPFTVGFAAETEHVARACAREARRRRAWT